MESLVSRPSHPDTNSNNFITHNDIKSKVEERVARLLGSGIFKLWFFCFFLGCGFCVFFVGIYFVVENIAQFL
jgi:uncharacterized membrane protein